MRRQRSAPGRAHAAVRSASVVPEVTGPEVGAVVAEPDAGAL
jgi:hypothetical protein